LGREGWDSSSKASQFGLFKITPKVGWLNFFPHLVKRSSVAKTVYIFKRLAKMFRFVWCYIFSLFHFLCKFLEGSID
jgi:hypothetical protein